MALPYSDAFFVQIFERESTEFVWEGHIRAFEYFGGVPWRISYDNAKTLVKKLIGVHQRELTRSFQQLVSHYLFDYHFCTVRRGNEKGVVEGGVKYVRMNFMVPVPQVGSLEELNKKLVVNCDEDLERKLRGKGAAKAKLLEEDKARFRPLPATSFDACLKQSTTATSLSLVRFDTNDYSVPTEWAHHPVVVKGYIDRVDVYYREKRIATHDRLWCKEGVAFNPVHYLAILGKPGTGLCPAPGRLESAGEFRSSAPPHGRQGKFSRRGNTGIHQDATAFGKTFHGQGPPGGEEGGGNGNLYPRCCRPTALLQGRFQTDDLQLGRS